MLLLQNSEGLCAWRQAAQLSRKSMFTFAPESAVMTVRASGAEMAAAGGASRLVASLSPRAASSCCLHQQVPQSSINHAGHKITCCAVTMAIRDCSASPVLKAACQPAAGEQQRLQLTALNQSQNDLVQPERWSNQAACARPGRPHHAEAYL